MKLNLNNQFTCNKYNTHLAAFILFEISDTSNESSSFATTIFFFSKLKLCHAGLRFNSCITFSNSYAKYNSNFSQIKIYKYIVPELKVWMIVWLVGRNEEK